MFTEAALTRISSGVAEVAHSGGHSERSHTAVFKSRAYSLMSCWPTLACRVFCLTVIVFTCFKIPCSVCYTHPVLPILIANLFLKALEFVISESQAFSFYMSF